MWCNTIPSSPPKSSAEGKFSIGLSDLFVVDENGELVDATDEQELSDPLHSYVDVEDFTSDFDMNNIDALIDAGISVSEIYADGVPTDIDAWIDAPEEDVDACEEYNREQDIETLRVQAENVLDQSAKAMSEGKLIEAKEIILVAQCTINAATHGRAVLFLNVIDEKIREVQIEHEKRKQARWMILRKVAGSRVEFERALQTDPIYQEALVI